MRARRTIKFYSCAAGAVLLPSERASGVYVRIIEPLAIIMRSDKIGNLYCNERARCSIVLLLFIRIAAVAAEEQNSMYAA